MASERKNKDGSMSSVKACHVPSYFAHHPEVDKNIVNDCELRSKQISVAERLHLEIKAHNQRQKIFQAHFWNILSTSNMVLRHGDVRDRVQSSWMSQCIYPQRKSLFAFNEFIEPITLAYRAVTDLYVDRAMDIAIEHIDRKYTNAETEKIGIIKINPSDSLFDNIELQQWEIDITREKVRQGKREWDSVIDRRMQKKIAFEAFCFIKQKRQIAMLETLVRSAVHLSIHYDAIHHYLKADRDNKIYNQTYNSRVKSFIGADLDLLNEVFYLSLVPFFEILLTVPWAHQFELLEQKALERSKA